MRDTPVDQQVHPGSGARWIRYSTAQPPRGGRSVLVPSHLPRLPPDRALATVTLPLHLRWSDTTRTFGPSDRRDRARVYEIVLREGTEDDPLAYIDGVLLVDLWDDLVLPRDVHSAWAPLIEQAGTAAAQ